MKYLQRFDTKTSGLLGYLTYDYVASYGNYDKYDDSIDNGVCIFDEPLYEYPTLFYTSTPDNPYIAGNTYYNDLSTLNSNIVGVPYSHICIRLDLFDEYNNPMAFYAFSYYDDSSSNSFDISYNEQCGVHYFRIHDGLTFPGTNFEFTIPTNGEHPIKQSRFIDVRFYYFSNNVIADIIPSDQRDDSFVVHPRSSGPSESEFNSTPMFIPTQWTTNNYNEGSYFTIKWMYYPGAYMSKLTADETPKQIQLNSENV